MQQAAAPTPAQAQNQYQIRSDDEITLSQPQASCPSAATPSTPLTSVSSSTTDAGSLFKHISHYIALGCLHCNRSLQALQQPECKTSWNELVYTDLTEEVKATIGGETARLLDAQWIRIFLHQPQSQTVTASSIVRVYLLPEDWARRYIDRNVKSLRNALRQLLRQIDTSPSAWAGDYANAELQPFDPWISAKPQSLYYLFNKLPSPDPSPFKIKSRYTRKAVHELLESAAASEWDEWGEQPLAGLRTRLYPYQARSASLMIERESAPQLQLDPRLEVRLSPNGQKFYFGARDGSFMQEPRYYETPRGGVLAESMGLGKTIICLAVILATKGQLPQIPAMYQPPPPTRDRVGSLADMAASTLNRHAVPAKLDIELAEALQKEDYSLSKDALRRNLPYYEIPPELPRMKRSTRMPPARQLVMCSATIIVVPRNLLHQWQSEVNKHVLSGGLRILVVDSIPTRASKAKTATAESENMKFTSELPAPTELMEYDVIMFTRSRFEQEIKDGADTYGRRTTSGVARLCNCPYIGSSRIPDCNCVDSGKVYESPLKKLHFLRILIDEGHHFSSSVSNAVLVAKQIKAERRWVVSGSKYFLIYYAFLGTDIRSTCQELSRR
jgi:SNF2 family DNA or RNA helicase